MKKGQTSVRNKIQDILCPFTDIIITQGSGMLDGQYSHKGTRAIDVIGKVAGEKYPYYAPFKCKAVYVSKDYGQTVWKSIEKVRFADGTIDYCTFLTAHDDTINYGEGLILEQGVQIGNMGMAGNATGVHCHIEFAKGDSYLETNKYGVVGLHNAIEFEDACFMDNTNIISGVAKWIYLKDVKVEDIERTDYEFLKKQYEEITSKYNELNEKLNNIKKIVN